MPFFPQELNACPEHSVNCLAFSSDTRYLASGGDDGSVYIHAFKQSSSQPLKAEYSSAVTALKWIPETQRLFIGLASGSVHLLTIDGASRSCTSGLQSAHTDFLGRGPTVRCARRTCIVAKRFKPCVRLASTTTWHCRWRYSLSLRCEPNGSRSVRELLATELVLK